jgi:hypothetical protein
MHCCLSGLGRACVLGGRVVGPSKRALTLLSARRAQPLLSSLHGQARRWTHLVHVPFVPTSTATSGTTQTMADAKRAKGSVLVVAVVAPPAGVVVKVRTVVIATWNVITRVLCVIVCIARSILDHNNFSFFTQCTPLCARMHWCTRYQALPVIDGVDFIVHNSVEDFSKSPRLAETEVRPTLPFSTS